MDNYVGKRLEGRYEVQEIIGVGGMSVVYKAYDNVDDRTVAIKILKDEFLNNEEFKRRFKNESKAIALLSHKNIVKVYDVNFGESLQYIVMEYIDGITLKEYINKIGAITWNDALYFMTQILRAVQHAHDKGIVHRDIKPQNIILLSNGDIKVTDFGIARFSRSETKTLTEQAIGSVHYIAPEQAKGEFTDEKADIYSLGVVLYEMLTGEVPFEADSAVSVALMQVQADAKRLTDINPNIPLGLEQICIHAMQKNPVDRYQTATEMLIDIEEIIKNPNTTFNYTVKEDLNPTRIVDKIDGAPASDDVEAEEEGDPEHKKKVITAIAIGSIVLVAAIVLIVMAFTNGFNTKTVILENFVDQSYDEIKDDSNYSSKYEFIAEYEKSDEDKVGLVLRQEPEAGSKVIEGSQVTLYVGVSNKDLVVPNVYEYTPEQAKQELAKSGIKVVTVKYMNSESVAEGKVMATDPKQGSVVSSTDEVIIIVSAGPSTTVIETLKVPDVTGLTQEGARAFLEKYGFTNVHFVTQASELRKGTVIDQTPSYGSNAKANALIKVVISSGVTTTTTQKALKVSMTIKLPVIENETGYATDNLIIMLDGEVYSKREVTLNGKNDVKSITCEGNKTHKIVVSLEANGSTETKIVDGSQDEEFVIDFGFDGPTNSNTPSNNDDD
ncbi:MAG: Stk1 family PASTA domain-containing Ser/Thr kinase [Eubacterium sp.]